MNQPVNLRQIAAVAGSSLATVSRALRNDPKASRKTCQRIQAVATELGYTPNPLVSTLMASKVRRGRAATQQVIAYLNPFRQKDSWRVYQSLLDYFEGARERAAQFGYGLEEFWLREPLMNSRRMSDVLFNRGIQGVLLLPLGRGMGHLSLNWSRFSVATIGYSLARPLVHRAVHDHLSAMRTALRHLQKQGYRRIALALDRVQNQRSNDGWSAGFGEFLMGCKPVDRTRPYYYLKYAKDPRKFERWVRTERPDCIIAGDIAVLEWLKGLGFSAPRDFGFVLMDRPEEDANCAGIYINARAIGAAAIDLIIGQMNRNERGLPELPTTLMITGQWLDGQTLHSALP